MEDNLLDEITQKLNDMSPDQYYKFVFGLCNSYLSKKDWISVKNKLPKKITNKVIVCCKNGYIGFGHYEKFQGKETWYNLESQKPFTDWDIEDCESYEVTHWMCLPDPPKGE